MESDSIKCVSYNILAQAYIDPHIKTRYRSINPAFLTWEYRRKLIIEQIANADIIALQEVDLNTDLNKDLPQHNIISKIIDNKHNVGILIAYKHAMFRHIETKSNSSAILAKFEYSENTFIFGCTHLRAGLRSKAPDRVSQLKSTFKLVDVVCADHNTNTVNVAKLPVCICGDFNDDFVHTTNLRELVLGAGYEISVTSDGRTSFYSYDENTRYTLDQIITIGATADIIANDTSACIPSEIAPSDHFAINFTLTI
jgi:mRNA deadenylase 3'-5' endonuclease subunit Ccr4